MLVDQASTDPESAPKFGSALSHLLLEALPSPLDPNIADSTTPLTLELFSKLCTANNARLVLKLAQVYQLKSSMLPDLQLLVTYIQELLLQGKVAYTPAVGLIMHFEVP